MIITTYTVEFDGVTVQTTSANQAEEWARDGVTVTAETTSYD